VPNTLCLFQSIQKILSGNKIQNGCHGGHLEKVVMPVIMHSLQLDGPYKPHQFSKAIVQSILKLLSRKEIQNGCHGGHIEKVVMLIFKRNFL
jgi:hypothetical protein